MLLRTYDARNVPLHAGDSRAVLLDADACAQPHARDASGTAGSAVLHSTDDHKPEQRGEIERIKLAGGFVTDKGR
jgi:serine/threonine protein phosphatase PrpC